MATKYAAIHVTDEHGHDEYYLRTRGGGFVPSMGGFATYDKDWMNAFTVEDCEVERGVFDDLPRIELESSGIVPDDTFIALDTTVEPILVDSKVE